MVGMGFRSPHVSDRFPKPGFCILGMDLGIFQLRKGCSSHYRIYEIDQQTGCPQGEIIGESPWGPQRFGDAPEPAHVDWHARKEMGLEARTGLAAEEAGILLPHLERLHQQLKTLGAGPA